MSTLHAQLEQTGSTIFQTLAGLVLDVKSKKPSAESVAAPNGDERDMEYLLQSFIVMNILQFIAIATVGYLDRKRKQREANALLAAPVLDDDSDSDDSNNVRIKEPTKVPDVIPDAGHSRDRAGTIRSIRSIRSGRRTSISVPEQHIPLLRSTSQTPSARSSRYLIPGAPLSSSIALKFTKAELRRGRIFAVLSGCMIVFAWLLFMGTAWYRLRSKEQRGHQMH